MSLKYIKDRSEKCLLDLTRKLNAGHARRMGGSENHFAIFQRLGVYKSYHISATYDRDVTNPQLLFKALRNIIVKNPFLATTVVTQDVPYEIKPRPNDYIKILDQVKYDDLVWDLRDEVKGLPLNKLCEDLNHRVLPYEDGKLFWRLGLLDNNTLAFMTNHVLHDGITGKNFFQDLTKEFNSQNSADPVDISETDVFNYQNDITTDSEIPLAAESVIDYTPPKWYFPEFLFNLTMLYKICDRTPILPDEGCFFHTFNINNDQISKIKTSLVQNSTKANARLTLTSYIQNAWIHTTTKLSIYENRFGMSAFAIPVDTRRYFPPETPQELYRYGLNVSGSLTHFYPIPKLKWSVISYLDKYLKKIVNTKRSIHAMGFMASEKILKDKHLDIDAPKTNRFNYRCGTLLTNIGILGGSDIVKDGYNIVDGVFSHHVNGRFYDFSILTVSTKTKGLRFVISAPRSIGQDRLDEICDEFHKVLLTDDIE